MILEWKGNAGLIIEEKFTRVAVDPFIEMNDCENRNSVYDYEDLSGICITHPHFDHILSVPQVLERNNCTLYCGSQTVANLEKMGCSVNSSIIVSDDRYFYIGDLMTHVYRSRHVKFDKPLIKETLKHLIRPENIVAGLKMARLLIKMPLKNEIFAWHFMGAQTNVLVMGSCAFDKNVEYPKNVDYLVVPLQGHSDIDNKALEMVLKINPKKVILDHFDNAFPPVSATIDTGNFVSIMREKRPDIEVIVPGFRERISL